MLKQGLQQSLQQKLSPLQIQMIRMLESTTLEMEERIQQELDENPVLEEVEGECRREELPSETEEHDVTDSAYDDADFSMSDYKTDDDTPSYKLRDDNYSEEDRRDSPLAESVSLHDLLHDQLRLKNIGKEIEELAEYVIGNIDHDGYLRREAESMVDDYMFQTGKQIADEKMREAVAAVQSLEPAGIGACNLQQCLLLQLQRKKQTPAVVNAIKILDGNFDDFSKKHYDKIMKKFNLEEEDLRNVVSEIIKLNPKPGSSLDSSMGSTSVQIIPDFIVECEDDEIILSLNDRNIPELRISQDYVDQLEMLTQSKKGMSEDRMNAALFIKQKVDAAKWFISSVKQRQETLRCTMQAIISKQKEFFKTGDETKLKPMVLKDIANATGFDISTISRVSNSKYVMTDFGVFLLKDFFSESMTTEDGEEVSNKEIKKILEECVQNEDKRSPLTDDRLSDILKEHGYVIARRTVAKYRKQLNIPVASLRKEI